MGKTKNVNEMTEEEQFQMILELSKKETSYKGPTNSKERGEEGLKSEKPLKEKVLENGKIIQIRKGDLTLEEVDMIVNAANKRLDHVGGLAGIN
jgi:hypothetical protein